MVMISPTISGVQDGRHFRPMRTSGTQHLIERTYREGGTFQWARETTRNAIEASATRIEFTVEWQAVETLGVYRRIIVDNGRGMDDTEIVQFFNTFGGGGKPIGGIHENFGVGAKTSLLPWNRYGVVVLSRVDGIDSMIWLHQDHESGEYGLKLFEVEDDDGQILWEAVVEPFDGTEEHGVDWRSVLPEWVGESGTAIVLMGSLPDQDTMLGDPERRNEQSTHGLAQYLNRRIWRLQEGFEISVDSLPVTDRPKWPKSRNEFTTKQSSARSRRVWGAEALILDSGNADGELKSQGMVICQDATEITWYLWEGDRPDRTNHAFTDGFIAAEYSDELYNYTSNAANYRQFGIADEAVRKRVWLIIRPPRYSQDGIAGFGVYPNSSRNQLLLQGGTRAGDPLPTADWAAEFADNMPEAIADAIRNARQGHEGTIEDDTWRERLADRFGVRWRIPKFRLSDNGESSMSPLSSGTKPKRRPKKKIKKRKHAGGRHGATTGGFNTGREGGDRLGEKRIVSGGVPTYRWVRASDLRSGILAAWMPNDPDSPEGVVLLNSGHPVIIEQVAYWQNRYAPHLAEQVRHEVESVYGEVAVAKVAHSEHLRGLMQDASDIDEKLRRDEALTMALLGLVAEESMIATRVGGKLGQRRRTSSQL